MGRLEKIINIPAEVDEQEGICPKEHRKLNNWD